MNTDVYILRVLQYIEGYQNCSQKVKCKIIVHTHQKNHKRNSEFNYIKSCRLRLI